MTGIAPVGFLPTGDSLAAHTAPAWWHEAKFGIMVTWGPYSVPAFACPTHSFYGFAEWYWFYQQVAPEQLRRAVPGFADEDGGDGHPHLEFHRREFGEDVTYDDLIDRWGAEEWDPRAWVELFGEAGARYLVLVAKHHDGVALWPSATTDRHTGLLGPRRDIVGELTAAAADSPLRTGLFYAMAEWFNPTPREGRAGSEDEPLFDFAFNRRRNPRNAFTGETVPYRGYRPVEDYAADHVLPQLAELVERYRPSILWFDLPGDDAYYRSNQIVADFYNASARTRPEGVAVNDRAGFTAHADFRSFEYGHAEAPAEHALPYEACCAIGTSFGHNREETEDLLASTAELVAILMDTVARGGNLLLNVGPRADGTIPRAQADRLRGIGRWLAVNGEAVYGSRAWDLPADGTTRFTVGADGRLYVAAPPGPAAELRFPVGKAVPVEAGGVVELLGYDGALTWRIEGEQAVVALPECDLARTEGEPLFVLRYTAAEEAEGR
ncbi:alpha-L-fucosidase [Actinospica durhamensis]|uniref:alpha-L-fucosidase n=1 Tax=Actinospica durhamensis TaxID=1508375 RepID=A0A941EPE0_9ACTN|nr:alpha-L-fucosidase [Actinospica durhamensis]MBR7836090.1 alpha-L-fucosidase [Actinospica durhamensis]